jgi:hypothetical protein
MDGYNQENQGSPMPDHEERRDMQERKKFIKEAFKEALKEYMDEKTQQFGKWSIRTLFAALVVALLYFVLAINGWQHIPATSHPAEIRK